MSCASIAFDIYSAVLAGVHNSHQNMMFTSSHTVSGHQVCTTNSCSAVRPSATREFPSMCPGSLRNGHHLTKYLVRRVDRTHWSCGFRTLIFLGAFSKPDMAGIGWVHRNAPGCTRRIINFFQRILNFFLMPFSAVPFVQA